MFDFGFALTFLISSDRIFLHKQALDEPSGSGPVCIRQALLEENKGQTKKTTLWRLIHAPALIGCRAIWLHIIIGSAYSITRSQTQINRV
jgi:hypothetical protein